MICAAQLRRTPQRAPFTVRSIALPSFPRTRRIALHLSRVRGGLGWGGFAGFCFGYRALFRCTR